MRPYRRQLERSRAARGSHDDEAALAVCRPAPLRAEATGRALSPLEELLLMHPPPWTAELIGGNRAKTIVRDALGYDVYLPGWGAALARAVNVADCRNPAVTRREWERE